MIWCGWGRVFSPLITLHTNSGHFPKNGRLQWGGGGQAVDYVITGRSLRWKLWKMGKFRDAFIRNSNESLHVNVSWGNSRNLVENGKFPRIYKTIRFSFYFSFSFVALQIELFCMDTSEFRDLKYPWLSWLVSFCRKARSLRSGLRG